MFLLVAAVGFKLRCHLKMFFAHAEAIYQEYGLTLHEHLCQPSIRQMLRQWDSQLERFATDQRLQREELQSILSCVLFQQNLAVIKACSHSDTIIQAKMQQLLLTYRYENTLGQDYTNAQQSYQGLFLFHTEMSENQEVERIVFPFPCNEGCKSHRTDGQLAGYDFTGIMYRCLFDNEVFRTNYWQKDEDQVPDLKSKLSKEQASNMLSLIRPLTNMAFEELIKVFHFLQVEFQEINTFGRSSSFQKLHAELQVLPGSCIQQIRSLPWKECGESRELKWDSDTTLLINLLVDFHMQSLLSATPYNRLGYQLRSFPLGPSLKPSRCCKITFEQWQKERIAKVSAWIDDKSNLAIAEKKDAELLLRFGNPVHAQPQDKAYEVESESQSQSRSRNPDSSSNPFERQQRQRESKAQLKAAEKERAQAARIRRMNPEIKSAPLAPPPQNANAFALALQILARIQGERVGSDNYSESLINSDSQSIGWGAGLPHAPDSSDTSEIPADPARQRAARIAYFEARTSSNVSPSVGHTGSHDNQGNALNGNRHGAEPASAEQSQGNVLDGNHHDAEPASAERVQENVLNENRDAPSASAEQAQGNARFGMARKSASKDNK